MNSCCDLGDIQHYSEEVLYETDNFFVTPTIGQIGIEGYLLVVSKECFKGTGNVPEKLHTEMSEVIDTTKSVLKSVYGLESQIFEHGPHICDVHGGGCLDHAHLHIVPGVDLTEDIAADLLTRLDMNGKFYRVDRVEGFKRVMDIFNAQKSSYFLAESPDKKRIVMEVNFHIPSQYMRKMIANQRQTKQWDWTIFPDFETYERTMDTLANQF